MKKPIQITFLVLFVLFSSTAIAQTEESTSDSKTKYVYCELVGFAKFMSNKVTVTINSGSNTSIWDDNRIKDDATGKAKQFNSMIDAMNFMAEGDWEFVESYIVAIPNQPYYYHWLLKKEAP